MPSKQRAARERRSSTENETRPDLGGNSAAESGRRIEELHSRQIELEREIAELRDAQEERTAKLQEDERTARAVVDGLTTHIAIVDDRGSIVAVNLRWREFAEQNDGPVMEVCEGANYLAACDAAAREKAGEAASVAAGIREVLAGQRGEFAAEYPCHSPTEERWFIVRVTPFPGEGPRRVVISHENITTRVQAEHAMRREREFSDRVIDTVETAVLLLTPEGRILRFNRHFAQLSGWSLEAVCGGDWFDLFLPLRDRERIRKLFRHALRVERTQGNVNAIITKAGGELEIEWHVALLHDAEGRLVGLLCSGHDITQSRRAEVALRESEGRYRQLVQGLPIALYTCDAKGRIMLFNAAAAALWGREPKLGRERWCGSHRLFTPDGKSLRRARCPMAMAVRQGEPIRDAELIIERPDGTRSHVLAFPDPIYDSADTVSGGVNLLVDITTLKVAENALRTSERNLRTLSRAVEQSPTSILITDAAGVIEYVNPTFTAVTGYSREDVLGKNSRLLKSDEHPPALFQEMWAAITAGRNWRGDLRNRKKNGELFWEFVVIAPIQDERGTVTHFVALKEDITARKRLEAEVLRIAEDERMRMAADLHDDICQELAGIQCIANLLRRDLAATHDPLAAQARRIEDAISRAHDHTRDVARGTNPVVSAGGSLVDALQQLAATTSGVRGIRCAFQCPVPVPVDHALAANELYRIAQEAIRNALHHSQAKRITVHLSETGGEISLAVSDNGRGLPVDVSGAPGMGLRVMQYRASLIGGQLSIRRRPRGGTEVICLIAQPPAKP